MAYQSSQHPGKLDTCMRCVAQKIPYEVVLSIFPMYLFNLVITPDDNNTCCDSFYGFNTMHPQPNAPTYSVGDVSIHQHVDPPAPHSMDPPAPHSMDPPVPHSMDPPAPHSMDPPAPHAMDPPVPHSMDTPDPH